MKVRELIKLWEDGRTSAEQEALLREYFLNEERVPDDLKAYSVLFRGYDQIASEKISTEPVLKKHNYTKWSMVSVAAALAIVCGIYFGSEPYCYVNGRAVRNPKEALSAVEQLRALNSLSKSTDALAVLDNCFERDDYQYIVEFLTSQN